jgi:hypothetical protein
MEMVRECDRQDSDGGARSRVLDGLAVAVQGRAHLVRVEQEFAARMQAAGGESALFGVAANGIDTPAQNRSGFGGGPKFLHGLAHGW